MVLHLLLSAALQLRCVLRRSKTRGESTSPGDVDIARILFDRRMRPNMPASALTPLLSLQIADPKKKLLKRLRPWGSWTPTGLLTVNN